MSLSSSSSSHSASSTGRRMMMASLASSSSCTCSSSTSALARAAVLARRQFQSSARQRSEKGKEADAAAAPSTSSPQQEHLASTPPPSYPFSTAVTFPTSTIQPKQASEPYSLLDRVNRSLVLPSTAGFRDLFARRHPRRIPPGSIVSVETHSSAGAGTVPGSSGSTSSFAGVLMTVKRRHQGVDNAFTVRANVGKPGTGTEVRFDVNSPWIKDVTVLKPNNDTRRARVYYMRRSDKYLSGVQGAIRNSMIAAEALTNEAGSAKRTSPPSKSSSKKKAKKAVKQ